MAPPLRVSGQYLTGASGPLAVVVWEPPEASETRFAILYVPPFGDEMNKSRRMAALAARALAMRGGTVVLLDPYGTGDSGGDHGDATWDGWQHDVATAFAWLAARTGLTPMVWGLRLGGLLAADLVARSRLHPSALVLWQPVTRGSVYVKQILRLATIQQRIDAPSAGADAGALRAASYAGQAVEVAGYSIHPHLLQGIGATDLVLGADVACPVIWREVSRDEPATLSPVGEQIAAGRRDAGASIDIDAVAGPAFWIAQEIAEAPLLVIAMADAVERQATAAHA